MKQIKPRAEEAASHGAGLPEAMRVWVVAEHGVEAAEEACHAIARTYPRLDEMMWKPVPPDYGSQLHAANEWYDAAVEVERHALDALKAAVRECVEASTALR